MCKRKFSVIIFIFVGALFVYVDVANGWKLRDLTQKDENKVTPKRQVFRDLPMGKVDTAIDDGDADDDDDKTKVADENFVFEKVHSTHFDLPPPRTDGENSPSDDDDDVNESDEDDENESNQSENENKAKESEPIEDKESDSPSILSTVLKIPLNIFGGKSDDSKTPDSEPASGFFSWFSVLRKDEKSDTKKATDASDPNALSTIDWFSYLDRKPFNLILKYIRTDENDSKDEDDNHKDANSKAIKEREPIATEHFEHLLLNLPSFVPNYSKIDDVDCKRMGQIFQRQIRGQKMWALQSKIRYYYTYYRFE